MCNEALKEHRPYFFFFFFVFWSCIALYLSEIAMMLLSLLFCFVLLAPFLELILKLIADRTSFYHYWVLKKISNTSQFLTCEQRHFSSLFAPRLFRETGLKGNETSKQSGEERWEEAVFAGHILSNKGKNPLYLNPKCWNVKWAFNSFQFFTFPQGQEL